MVERMLALEFLRVTEAAALAAARRMGQGDNERADQAAVEAMRQSLEEIDIAGTVVIGEGERDEALIVGPPAASKVSMDYPVGANLQIIADSLDRHVEDLTVIILDRPRHKQLIEDVRDAGALGRTRWS